jgi:hypothetical protein
VRLGNTTAGMAQAGQPVGGWTTFLHQQLCFVFSRQQSSLPVNSHLAPNISYYKGRLGGTARGSVGSWACLNWILGSHELLVEVQSIREDA